MAKTPTHYDRLGVARNAPEEVIRGAYKALAQKYHPDKNLNNPETTTVMQAINLAYDVLSDPSKRADYDARLNQEEMRERARFQETVQPRPSSPSSSYAGRSSRGVPVQPSPLPRRSGIGSILLIVILVVGIFMAFFISGSVSLPGLPYRPDTSAPAFTPAVPRRAAETFVPKETTPRELAICIFSAAKEYNVPPSLLLSLLSAEGGSVGEKTPVTGAGYISYNLGLMQINSFWIPALDRAWKVSSDMALQRLRDDACTNIGVGAWILQGVLGKSGDLRSVITLYRTAAHHAEASAGDAEYVDRVIKLMTLYKSVHGPEDLVGQQAGEK